MITTSCNSRDHFNAHGWAVQQDFLQQRELDELRQVRHSNSLRVQASLHVCAFSSACWLQDVKDTLAVLTDHSRCFNAGV